jgi:hypothetical protein
MVEAIVGNGLDQIRFGVLDFFLIDTQPARKSFLHNVFSVLFAAHQIISDGVQQRLIERYRLRLCHFSSAKVRQNRQTTT